jgi:hypothetical protein
MKKQTHTIPQIHKLIEDKMFILENAETAEEKKRARSSIKRLEKLIVDVDYKIKNGHKYPDRMYHSYTKPMDVKAIKKLIDSVPGMKLTNSIDDVMEYRKVYEAPILNKE